MLACVAVDDNRVVKQKLPALGIVAPNAVAPRKGGRPAEQCAKHVQSLLHPIPLVDRLVAAILARDKRHQQR